MADPEQGITPEVAAILEKPFTDRQVQVKRGQGNRPQSYVSHGLVTERLTEADPNWGSRVLHVHTFTDPNGALHCGGVTLELTVRGVTRTESGGPARMGPFADEIKNAQSDALKRAAMRFGVALAMWEDLIDSEGDDDRPPPRPQGNHEQAQAQYQARRQQQAQDASGNANPRPGPSQPAQRGNPPSPPPASGQRVPDGSGTVIPPQGAKPAPGVSQGYAKGGKFACRPDQVTAIRDLRSTLDWGLDDAVTAAARALGDEDVKLDQLGPEPMDTVIAYMERVARIKQIGAELGWTNGDLAVEVGKILEQPGAVNFNLLSPDGQRAVLDHLEAMAAGALAS